jgi:hypothetical protein
MNIKAVRKAIEALKDIDAYRLASMAEVHSPDTRESSGAQFLTGIRDSVVEQLDYYCNGDYADADDASGFIDSVRQLSPFDGEIQDGAPSIWNYERMRQLVDLAAWDEDTNEFGDSPDIITAAGYALYAVAGRLVDALLQEVADVDEEDDEE